ncbi:hypothetical protein CPC08DRAFT_314014 [Agrocybe pediades]|nr:hypothetical protein CPC08DRAFT_314014 [Agrocybe pediades]
MAKKSKGKQKQDEKAQTSNATSPVSEPVVQPEIITQLAHESIQPAAWGTPVEQGWPANANNEVHWEQGADSWEPAMQGGGGGWGGAESLLDPPANQGHGGLPTIYEQPSSSSFHESGQNRTPAMSVQETYSEHYSDQDPQHWDNLQNRTVNGTAAPSAAGSPVPRQQHISLAEAAEAAGRQHDRVSLASEARYQKEDKAPLNDPSAGIQSFMASPAAQNASIRGHPLYDPKAPKQLSTASAYAAQFDTKRNRSSSTKPGHAGQSPETPTKPGKVAWRDDRPLFEGTATIQRDLS